MMENKRMDLINDICAYLVPIVEDISEIRDTLYMIMNDYEITSRCTEIALLKQDRNEFLLKKFLIAKTVRGCTERTLKYYATEIPKILLAIGKTVDEISADDIRYYMALRQRRDKVSKTTVSNEYRIMSSFFGWLHGEELIQKNPIARVDNIKVEKIKKEAFTEIEVEKIRNHSEDTRTKAIIEILFSTGCRVKELVNIKIEDIEGSRILVHGKGEKDRYVYLNAKAQYIVEKYLMERDDPNPYLFPGGYNAMSVSGKEKGKIMKADWWKYREMVHPSNAVDTGTIEQRIRKIGKKEGIKRAHPHKFRRTCATMALRRGMPIEQVSKMLGHENIATTQIYLDLAESDLGHAHQKYVV